MNQPVPEKIGIVIGVDVGGPKKGFHAVALRDGCYSAAFAAADASTVVEWCHVLMGTFKTYGDANEGFIVVPDLIRHPKISEMTGFLPSQE